MTVIVLNVILNYLSDVSAWLCLSASSSAAVPSSPMVLPARLLNEVKKKYQPREQERTGAG
jgi:hypothetical protein